MHQIICQPLTGSRASLHFWTGSAWTTTARLASTYETREAALAEVRRILKGTDDLHAARVADHKATWPAGCSHPQAIPAKLAARKAERLARRA